MASDLILQYLHMPYKMDARAYIIISLSEYHQDDTPINNRLNSNDIGDARAGVVLDLLLQEMNVI